MYIIAEVGSNWKTLGDCLMSVRAAKNSLASAVKFQYYNHRDLYGYYGPELPGELPMEWLPRIKEECDRFSIDFMCTAFSSLGIGQVDPYVKMHKVASSCNTTHYIMNRAMCTGKPTMISLGAMSEAEIMAIADKYSPLDWIPTYCVANYPAKRIDLRMITRLKEMFPKKDIGYSDHSIDVLNIPVLAKVAGATYLEKHFNATDYTDTPDAGHSLNPKDFKAMVCAIEDYDLPLDGFTQPEELDMLNMHKNRLVAIEDIKAGDELRPYYNVGVYRSKEKDLKGAHGFFIESLKGQKANVSFKQGEGIPMIDIV